jgi:hypothetical protein
MRFWEKIFWMSEDEGVEQVRALVRAEDSPYDNDVESLRDQILRCCHVP